MTFDELDMEIELGESKSIDVYQPSPDWSQGILNKLDGDNFNPSLMISPSAWSGILRQAYSSPREVGGVLLGHCYRAASGNLEWYVHDFIVAKYSLENAASLTFTHETWNYINKEISTKFPEAKITGWYHTHPGFGIFLSGYDTFIQKHFFPGENQIALVVDPLRGSFGFFAWQDGKIVRMNGICLYTQKHIDSKDSNAEVILLKKNFEVLSSKEIVYSPLDKLIKALEDAEKYK